MRESHRARELMAAGEYAQAIPIYRKLVQTAPGNTGLLLDLGLAEHMSGDERAAIAHLEAVLRVQPNVLGALMSLGAARLAVNDARGAIPPLQKVIAREPDNDDARGMLAGALLASGRAGDAAEQYRKLSAKSPDDPRAWYGLGNAYQALARAAFDRLQKLDGRSPFVAALVADTRVQRGQYRSAFFFYREALKELPDLHGIHTALAEVYRKTGHPDWAAAEDAKEAALPAPDCARHAPECQFLAGKDVPLTMLPKMPPPSAESLFWQAKAANELALQSFFRVGQLPNSVELHRVKAEIARDQGQYLDSAREWRSALELMPGDARLQHELTVSLFMAGDYQSAHDSAASLLKSDPTSAELNFIAGDSLLRLEHPDEAAPLLKRALQVDSAMLAAHASLGLALSRAGKNVEAVSHLEKALELDDDGSLHYQLARAYQGAGDAAKARATMTKYQEMLKKTQEQKEEVAREAQIGPPQ